MIRLIIILLFIIYFPIFPKDLLNNNEVCKYFKLEDKNKKNFNPYTGKTNIKFKEDGIYECKDSDTVFRIFMPRYFYIEDLHIFGNIIIEVKNKKIRKIEIRDKQTTELQFLAEYNQYGINGKMYTNKIFGLGNDYNLELNYKDGKPFGDILEYYDNGKLYRKSHLIKNNNYHPFSTPDDYSDYVEYYEIYDINTGEILKKEKIINKTGIIWYYNSSNGRLESENYLKKGNVILERIYNKKGEIIQENNYEKIYFK